MASFSAPIFAATLALALAGAASGQTPPKVKPSILAHIDAANLAGGQDFTAAERFCDRALPANLRPKRQSADDTRVGGGPNGQEPGPAKVFDNFYYLGVRSVTAWTPRPASS